MNTEIGKIVLNEEDESFKELRKKWIDQARQIKTEQQLTRFIHNLLNGYSHDYGTVVRAIGAMAIGAASLGAFIEGITGFQASCVMWEFVREWNYYGNQTGLKLIDYDNMLYPQYASHYEKTLSAYTWEKIQELARKNLEEVDNAHPDVKAHWQSIVDGKVPFGYEVKDD